MPGRTTIVERQVALACAPDDAYAWITDPTRLPAWMADLAGLRWVRLPPDAVGRTFVVERRVAGRVQPHPAEILTWEPPRRLRWRILQDQLTIDRDSAVEPTGAGSLLRVRLELAPVTGIAWASLPWLRWDAARRLDAELDRLRLAVERGWQR